MNAEWTDLEIVRERHALERTRALMDDLVESIKDYPWMWAWGDGYGGAVMEDLRQRLQAAGFETSPPPKNPTARTISTNTRWAVYERDGYVCVACGADEKLCVDHIVPRKKGGTNALENLQTLCRSCNTSKGTKSMDEWLATQ